MIIFEPIIPGNRLIMYNWQHKNWPQFEFDYSSLEKELMLFMMKAGEINGMLSALPHHISTETIIQTIVSEAIKTSAIEGEVINRLDVMSSIKNNLGLHTDHKAKDKNAIGLSKMLVDVRNTFKEELTEVKLLEWHQMLMKNNKKVQAGKWRSHQEPMRVISGSVANPKIHFEAPPSKNIPKEIKQFIKWYNNCDISTPPVKAAIAHLYFESIHPFEDGNGRIGRAIAEKAVSQCLGMPVLFSISNAIEARRREYYDALQKAQRTMNISAWIKWFTSITLDAQEHAEKMIHFTIDKMKFFDKYENQLNERQKKVVNKMMEEGPNEFIGGMNAKKYMSITGVSKATATRDLQELVQLNIFSSWGSARTTRYSMNIK